MSSDQTTPAMKAPEGESYNLVDPFSLRHLRFVVGGVSLGVAFIFVFMRTYVRILMKQLHVEDCMYYMDKRLSLIEK
ncbi:hypothetical protein PFICI_11159 [Pestalotiopsis fici W106-1]|uniref:Uncharacterized protein n=1 Tax=Pestalotiopsis fici (strain W106-1 / CGMCC3.15140) TaxID=1229662 RepID=W3WTV5_PESFW|nr:uncharacterized protein PFICI_11159 [Pestalotiopsis fici W106-1]ETS77285.1 hypothetical protein PFICI_11159 [Pestalotiopsis fici W106-1]